MCFATLSVDATVHLASASLLLVLLRARVGARQQRTHVAGDPGHAEQAALIVEQGLDRTCVHASFVHEIEKDARVDRAATGTHRQSVQRREAHRRSDAPACPHADQQGP